MTETVDTTTTAREDQIRAAGATARPTPADPLPGVTRDARVPTPKERRLPPELGPDALAVLEGRSFMLSDSVGDVPGGTIGGLVHGDTRFLSKWVLTVNGARLLALRSRVVDHYSAAFFLTNPELPGLPANSLALRRLRFVGNGLHESIRLQSFLNTPVRLEVRLAIDNDFADLFEIKDYVRDRSAAITRTHAADGSAIRLGYASGDYTAETVVQASLAGRIVGDEFVWDLDVPADGDWTVELHVPLKLGKLELQPTRADFGDKPKLGDDPLSRWLAELPRFESDSALLKQVVDKSTADLPALRIALRLPDAGVITLPAAGLPWFLTVFGRDTLITAYQSLWLGPQLAKGALLSLATLQGKKLDDFTDEEPGKILHEYRTGELTQLGLKPHSPYYGTADATILWLILLSDYWRWTGDADLVVSLRANALAALDWIDKHGDRDGDGYVEYQTRSIQGLGNQCWRDSWDGVQFADATLPYLPIATAEIQGYAYDAKLRLAELAEGPLADAALAKRLREQAALLRERFNRDYWIDRRGGYYAIGLDGDKRQIDSLTSNVGQLLWSGIVPTDRAAAIAAQLTSDALFSGWGVRTLSRDDAGYNPIGYHLGTIWPHDNSLIALGLARYGFRDEANRIILALLEAASFSDYRLPEAFAGFRRSLGAFPVPYPTACSPQAWATAAPFLFIQTMLGLEARDGRLTLDPHVPDEIGRICVSRVPAFGTHWDIEAIGTNGHVRLSR
jgi:glycogen debranching enzyme